MANSGREERDADFERQQRKLNRLVRSTPKTTAPKPKKQSKATGKDGKGKR